MRTGLPDDTGLRPVRAYRSLIGNFKRDAQAAPPAIARCGSMRTRRLAPRSMP
jgi:hypothetical protein